MHACLSYYYSKCTGGARTLRGFQGGSAPGSRVQGAAAPGGVQGAEPLAGVELPGQLGKILFLLNCFNKNVTEILFF